MAEWIVQLDWTVLVFAAIALGLAPMFPEPHLIEKLRMLRQGKLRRPIDIFDLLMHSAPLFLIVAKVILEARP